VRICTYNSLSPISLILVCLLMPITPEDRALENIDKLLVDGGRIVQNKRSTNLSVGRGLAARASAESPSTGALSGSLAPAGTG
jgi:hypothetical protein